MNREPSDRSTSVEYDPETGSYTAEFDSESRQPSHAVLEVMSHAIDADYVDLDPLYDAIDPHALDTICRTPGAYHPCTVQFAYAGHCVTVTRRGEVEVEPLDGGG